MRLSKLLEGIQGSWVEKADEDIFRISADSREKGEKALFICLSGQNTDGHNYVEEAIKNGAVAVVSEHRLTVGIPQFVVEDTREALAKIASKFYGDPSKHMKIVGVTGTNGKTTTVEMIAEIWRKAGYNVGTIGTLGVAYADKRFAQSWTTPDPIFLQKTLAEMLRCGVDYVAMEVSAHALYYKKTDGVVFSACIFTNLTHDHLDFFENMSVYKAAKLRLFSMEICPLAIVNGDEETGREIGKMRALFGGRTLFYGQNNPADCFAIITNEGLNGTECMLNLNDRLCRVSLPLIGLHNVYNATAAACCCVELQTDIGAIALGLTGLKRIIGRLEKVAVYNDAEIYVDFAHTPDGLIKSIASLKKYCKGRLTVLFGCGGNRDKSKRAAMGEAAAKSADFCVLTSDNPRYEDPLDIIAMIEKGYRRFSTRYVVVPERRKAIGYALDFLRKGDILLIAGKGGEEYQEIMGIKYPFSDHTVVEELLKEKRIDGLI